MTNIVNMFALIKNVLINVNNFVNDYMVINLYPR